MKKGMIGLVLAGAMAIPAAAQVEAGQSEVGFRPAWIATSTHDRGFKSGWGLNLDYTYFITKRWGLEFNLQRANFPDDSLTPFYGSGNQWSFRGSAIINIKPDDSFNPYLRVGLGYADMDASGLGADNDSATEVFAGVGLKKYLNDTNIFLRWEVLAIHGSGVDQDFGQPSDSYTDVEFGMGLGWVFGGDPCSGKRGDADGDGVDDCNDKCANTPPKSCATIDANGCYVMKDSDGDGVNDCDDQCPNTPPKSCAGIDAKGCYVMRDGDMDGVNDCDDQCPNTRPEHRSMVDSRGCYKSEACENKIVIDESIMKFPVNKAIIPEAGKAVLNKVAEELLSCRTLKVEISGHTSHTGGRAWNEKLSRMRAEAVMEYLTSKGVPADQMSAVGYAWDRPMEDTPGSENPMNRRVEVDNEQ